MECETSNGGMPPEESDVTIEFNINDDDIDSPTAETTLQTKTTKLIHRAIGDSHDLTLLDNLRAALKEKKQEGHKPNHRKIQQYKTLTAKLNLKVCSLRCETKLQVVNFERTYYKQHGSFPDRCKHDDYGTLRRKYDFLKKLLQRWDSYIGL